MNEEQPIILPPTKLRLPQRPPQQVEEARRRYLPALIKPPVPWQSVPQSPTSPVSGHSLPVEQPARWQETPKTPMPQFFPTIETQVPQTPPIRLGQPMYTRTSSPRYQTMSGRPVLHYIPNKAEQKEPGLGESLLGCGVLLVIGILILALLYYLSLPL